ncbi:MAG: TetR/AcrR family transcriptional regulator [Bacillota bacterium]|nr:TetR/AcrR family transcriptional regulator [Bacillota bacterium]
MGQQRAKQDFITAFWKLYEKKPIHKISITELCQCAGYHRSTFYVYFKDIYDLLDRAVDELIAPAKTMFKNVDQINSFLRDGAIGEFLLNIFKKNEAYVAFLVKHHHSYILEDKIKSHVSSILKNNGLHSEFTDYMMAYHISAVFGVIKFWFENDKSIQEEEMVHLIVSISTQGIFTVFRQKFIDHNGLET